MVSSLEHKEVRYKSRKHKLEVRVGGTDLELVEWVAVTGLRGVLKGKGFILDVECKQKYPVIAHTSSQNTDGQRAVGITVYERDEKVGDDRLKDGSGYTKVEVVHPLVKHSNYHKALVALEIGVRYTITVLYIQADALETMAEDRWMFRKVKHE